MRKSLIAQSVAALIAGFGLAAANAAVVDTTGAAGTGTSAATSLVVKNDGVGHFNIVPYYSAQEGNDTYINIVNTDTRNGKAVKVRFRGASNSDDVLDFTVLLSAGDKFSFAVTRGADGTPQINTVTGANRDTSCTIGDGVNNLNGQKFVLNRLPKLADADRKSEAREGYVEIFNMADIPPNSGADSLSKAITHVKDASGKMVAPCTFTAGVNNKGIGWLATDITQGSEGSLLSAAAARGLAAPTTGLMTNWTVINVQRASAYTGAATAIEAVVTEASRVPGFGNIVFFPQAANSVTSIAARDFTSDPLFRTGDLAAYHYDFPDMSTPYLPGDTDPQRQATFLTKAIATTSVSNEYIVGAGLNAKTDWTFSMPTRRYSVAVRYDTPEVGDHTPVYSDLVTDYFTSANSTMNTATGRTHQLCVSGISYSNGNTLPQALGSNYTTGGIWDYDEGYPTVTAENPFVISPNNPATPTQLRFCGEVSVLKFGVAATGPSVLNASVAVAGVEISGLSGDRKIYDSGWARISTPGLSNRGLPVVGYAVTEISNGNMSYGQTFRHRYTNPVTP